MSVKGTLANDRVVIRVVMRENGEVQGALATRLQGTTDFGAMKFTMDTGRLLVPSSIPTISVSGGWYELEDDSVQQLIRVWQEQEVRWARDEQMVAVRYPQGLLMTEANQELLLLLTFLLLELRHHCVAATIGYEGPITGRTEDFLAILVHRLEGYVEEKRGAVAPYFVS